MPLPPDISARRGAVVTTALAGTVLLVVGYGSGIGVIPATSGDAEAAAAPPVTSTPPDVALPPPPAVSVDSVDTVGTTHLSTDLPAVQLSGPGIVYPWLPDGPTRPGPQPLPRPPSSPPVTPPSPATPPVTPPSPDACSDLVGALLDGLTAYLGSPVVDVDLVRQVSDLLGLERYLASGRPLTEQLVAPLAPVLDVVPSVLGGLGLGAGPVRSDAALLQGLRALLEVPAVAVGAVADVTDATLRSLLDAVVGGC